jgi:hypothetical protein
VSLRTHRTRAAHASYVRAEIGGKTAGTRAPWLARKTARVKKRVQRQDAPRTHDRDGGEPAPGADATLADDEE